MGSFKRFRLACIPLMFILLGAGMLGVLHRALSDQSKKLASINLAGKQRMLNQQHMLNVLLVSQGNDADFRTIREEMKSSLGLLRNGGTHEFGSIQPASEANVIESLNEQEEMIRINFQAADDYLQLSAKYGGEMRRLREELTKKTEEAHVVANNIVLLQSELRANSSTVNLSGRQRTLNQRHARQVLDVVGGNEQDISATRSMLLDSLDLIQNGGEHKFGSIDRAGSKELRDAIALQRQQFSELFSLSDEIISYSEQGETELYTLREALAASAASLHRAADNVAIRISESGERDKAKGTMLAFFVGSVLSVIGCTVALLIMRSIIRDVAHTATKIGDLSEKDLTDVTLEMQKSADSTAERASSSNSAAADLDSEAQSLVAAVEQFKGSIDHIVDNSSKATEIVTDAVELAERTSQTISELENGASAIYAVVKTINSVAEQTNLLALNATIEAARAGSSGKGFAVVANEVKELAKQTQAATQDIERQIAENTASTEKAINAISDVSKIIFQIKDRQAGISTSVHQQSDVTDNISECINRVAQGTAIIASDLSSISDFAQTTSNASRKNRETADRIENLANELRGAVSQRSSDSYTVAT